MKKLFRSVRSAVEGWFGSLAARRAGRRPSPALELLEDRMVPAAMTFQVTNNLDEVGGDPGTSLREAILAANANVNAPNETDTITFRAGLRGANIQLSLGQIDITDDLEIRGLGKNDLTVSGAEGSRIFQVLGGEGLSIDTIIAAIKLKNGDAQGEGGAILYSNVGQLTIQNSILEDNVATGDGGAVSMDSGSLSVINSQFRRNLSGDDAGAIDAPGGVDIVGSSFRKNQAEDVAGALRFGSGAIVLRSTFDGNVAGSEGGAIFSTEGSFLGLLDSTVSRNRADFGGGVYFSGGEGFIVNSTISNNRAFNQGGGVYLDTFDFTAGGGPVEEFNLILLNATVTENRVRSQSPARNVGTAGSDGINGGGIFVANGTLRLENSIVAGNRSNGRLNDLGALDFTAGISSVTIDALFSLIQAPDGNINGINSNNILGVSPQLGSLTNNGGPTETHLPAFTSPVINAGNNALLRGEEDLILAFDQRRIMVRIFDGTVDIGAVEVGRIAIRHHPL